MNVSKYRKPKFLKKEQCPIVLIISGAEERDYSRNASEHDLKIVINSEEKISVSLNDTNLGFIIDLYGDETDDWIGEKIGFIYDPNIEYEDEVVGGFRAVKPEEARLKRRPSQSPVKEEEEEEPLPF